MTRLNLSGTITALVTPFISDASKIDWASFENLLDMQITAGVSGLVACGSTGEAFSLSDDEYVQVIKFVLKKSGTLPVLAGVTHPSFAESLKLSLLARDSGAHALLLAPSPYVKPTQQGILAHFRRISEATGLPMMAYNIPGRSCVSISPETIQNLFDEKIIIGVKESSGDVQVALEMIRLAGPELVLVSGEDALVLSIMSGGGKGVITACGNLIPHEFVEITESVRKGDFVRAQKAQLKMLPIVKACFMESNPIPVKAALALKGVITSAAVRLPLTSAKEGTLIKFRELM